MMIHFHLFYRLSNSFKKKSLEKIHVVNKLYPITSGAYYK